MCITNEIHSLRPKVTEREVLKGILNYKNGHSGALAYIRMIDKMEKVMTLVKVANFIDMASGNVVDLVCILNEFTK